MLQSRREVSLMDFGLLPEFSTPVQKPVENADLLHLDRRNSPIYGHFLQAKARRARFEAVLRVSSIIQTASAPWR
jgi:hypothetical protein